MRNRLLYILILLVVIACGTDTDDREIIARVNSSILFKEDMMKDFPVSISVEDSSLYAQNYINEWALKQLLLQKANINLADETKEIDELVIKYKQDLLINKYKEAVVKQELDTLVTADNIAEFYTKNGGIFKLNEELIQFRYIAFSNDINNKNELVSWFKKDNEESNLSMSDQQLQLLGLHLNDSIWVKVDDVKKNEDIFKNYTKSELLSENKTIQKEDDSHTYIVQIKDVLLRNENAPVGYAKPTIIQMILHQRKLGLLQKIEETLTDDAIKNKEYQIY